MKTGITETISEAQAIPLPTDWERIEDLFADIKQHVAATGEEVLTQDYPVGAPDRIPRIGWTTDSGKTWTFRTTKLRESLAELPEERAEDLRAALKTQTSRAVLARQLSTRPSPPAPTP